MSEEFKEYATFTVKSKEGEDVELAVVDEFEFEHKNYVVGARIEGDEISQEGLHIYKVKVSEDDFSVEKINNQVEYEKVHDEQSPTIILHLYTSLIEEEVRADHCNICRESHKSFFISEETNCAWCKIKGYQNRCDQHIEVKKSYYKQLLERREYGE